MSYEPALTIARPTPLPEPRGALSEHVFSSLRSDVQEGLLKAIEATDAEDEAISLFVLQELSFRPLAGVDPAWEEDTDLIALRGVLEDRLEARLRAGIGELPTGGDLVEGVQALLDAADGPSLAGWMEEHGELDHLREFAVHRSGYQLKEADPHTWALPRLPQGRAKAALLEIQADEYGGTEPANAHAELFASTMIALDLDPGAGPDLDRLPAPTLTTSTFLNLLGRSRRLTGSLVAHLCVFEMTSVEPMARYAALVRRVVDSETSTAAARFFDVHVAADGYHERLAVEELLRGLEEEQPDLAADALFGAAGLIAVEQAFTEHLLDAWKQGRTSLRRPLEASSLSPRG